MFTPFKLLNAHYLIDLAKMVIYKSMFMDENNFIIYSYDDDQNIGYIKQNGAIHMILIKKHQCVGYYKCNIQEIIMDCYFYWLSQSIGVNITDIIKYDIFSHSNLFLPYPSQRNINNALQKLLLSGDFCEEVNVRDDGKFVEGSNKYFLIRNGNYIYIMGMNETQCGKPIIINKVYQKDIDTYPIDFIIHYLEKKQDLYCKLLNVY